MLRIKDSVDLKELEKFGFKEFKKIYSYSIASNYGNAVELSVWKEDRTIALVVDYEEFFTEDIDVFYDLIQAGLVEKV